MVGPKKHITLRSILVLLIACIMFVAGMPMAHAMTDGSVTQTEGHATEQSEQSAPDLAELSEGWPADQMAAVASRAPGYGATVVVDIGHVYGPERKDPGAISPDGRVREADQNMIMALKIARRLKQKDYNVYTTFKVADDIPIFCPWHRYL